MDHHEHWMRRAIRLAMNGRGGVEPNPMVGCVIVRGDASAAPGAGRVVGESYHRQFGGPHAEPEALAACTESPAGATAYVTLEPCCHTNKKTPPCVPKLIGAKVACVVVGCIDPNPKVSGRGIAHLRAAGIEVVAPVLEGPCRQLLAPFVARVVHRRPYVTLKWAETADQKVGAEGGRVVISNAAATAVVHRLRSGCDVIVVGANTVIEDDPMLTARDVPDARPMLRVVLDRRLRTPLGSRLVRTANEHPTRIYTSRDALDSYRSTVVAELRRRDVDVRAVTGIPEALHDLYDGGATHLLVEPGPTLARGWLRNAEPVDRVWVIQSPRRLGYGGLASADVPRDYVQTGVINLAGDTLTEYLNPKSLAYFAAEPSADFVFAAATAAAGSR